jgi:hypothetical protein
MERVFAALTLLMLLATLFPVLLTPFYIGTGIAQDRKDLYSGSTEFVVVALPLNALGLDKLFGLAVSSVAASPCSDEHVVIFPKLLPKEFSLSWVPTLNTYVATPSGSGVLEPGDILLLVVPKQGISGSCSWSVFANVSGLLERYVVVLRPGAKVFSGRGVEVLDKPLAIALYFRRGEEPLASDSPYDIGLVMELGNLLGIPAPRTRQVSSYSASVAGEWSSWVQEVRKAIQGLGIERFTDVRYETVQGFETPKQLYQFIYILVNKTMVTKSLAFSRYLGFAVYSSLVHVYASSTSDEPSDLLIRIKVTELIGEYIANLTDVDVWSYENVFRLWRTSTPITIAPEIPFDPSRRFNISVEFEWVGGAKPLIVIATITFSKYWGGVINETAKGVSILSTGIARVLNPETGLAPKGCRVGKASSYIPSTGYGKETGLVLKGSSASIVLDSPAVIGVLYDKLGNKSPVLYIDMCITSDKSSEGVVEIKVNGVTLASRKVVVEPKEFSYIALVMNLSHATGNMVKGLGPVVTIEARFSNSVEMYIDSVIEYLYAPDVWSPQSDMWWYINAPWYRLLVTLSRDSIAIARVGVAYITTAYPYEYARDGDVVVTAIATKPNNIRSITIATNISLHCLQYYTELNGLLVRFLPAEREGTDFEYHMDKSIAHLWSTLNEFIDAAKIDKYLIPVHFSKGVMATDALSTLASASTNSFYTIHGYITRDSSSDIIDTICVWASGANKYWRVVTAAVSFSVRKKLSILVSINDEIIVSDYVSVPLIEVRPRSVSEFSIYRISYQWGWGQVRNYMTTMFWDLLSRNLLLYVI